MQISVCLFFTYGISLKKWEELGILDREVLLYNALVARGVRVAFFTYGTREDLAYAQRLPGITIIPAYAKIKKAKDNKLAFLQSLLLPFIFRKTFLEYHILKTNQMWGAWVPLITKWLTSRRLLVRCGFEHYYFLIAGKHPKLERLLFYLFPRLVYSFAEHIIVTTDKIADFVTRRFFIKRNKISVLPNLVDTELFSNKATVSSVENRLLFVGRLNKEKNVVNLIKACRDANVGLDLVGRGELEPRLKDIARSLNADVRFLGTFPNRQLVEVFRKYQTFILPSLYEGNPKSLIEAMSCGKAVIGSNIDGINELITDGKTGILCGISVTEITSAILRIKDNLVLQRQLGENARQYIVNNFSLHKTIGKELAIYQNLLKNKFARIENGGSN